MSSPKEYNCIFSRYFSCNGSSMGLEGESIIKNDSEGTFLMTLTHYLRIEMCF